MIIDNTRFAVYYTNRVYDVIVAVFASREDALEYATKKGFIKLRGDCVPLLTINLSELSNQCNGGQK